MLLLSLQGKKKPQHTKGWTLSSQQHSNLTCTAVLQEKKRTQHNSTQPNKHTKFKVVEISSTQSDLTSSLFLKKPPKKKSQHTKNQTSEEREESSFFPLLVLNNLLLVLFLSSSSSTTTTTTTITENQQSKLCK
jgi:hypothetical protein